MEKDKDNTLTQENTGFVEVAPIFGRDFIAGSETAILETEVLPGGDWRPFYPTNATQLMKGSNGQSYGDSNACVSFAGVQSVETQLNFQIKTGRISAENLQWLKDNGYIDANGSVFISKRFTAKMSGTTPAVGNSLPAVWDSLKNHGCVPEATWPMPTGQFDALIATNKFNAPNDFWTIYYAAVPQAAKDLGLQFVARFPILYEWLVYPGNPAAGAKLLADLGVAPLEIATAVCSGWNTDDPIGACGAGTQHATLLGYVETDRYDILDHYVPFQKQFAGNYDITYAMRGVVGGAKILPPAAFQYNFTKQLTFNYSGNDAVELKALQTALQTLKRPGTAVTYMTPGVFGPFGPQTKAGLKLFESDNGIVDPQPGQNFGPQNRAKMNALLLALK